MSIATSTLGGRIDVLTPEKLSTEQKPVYERINGSQVPWAERVGFKAQAENGALIGPYNSQLLSPGVNEGYLDFLDAEKRHTTLSKRVREVVILSVGAVWKSEYEIYAHSAVGASVGLSRSAIESLAAGGSAEDLDAQERTAHRFARQLALERRVEADIYAETEKAFGKQGLADILYLIGIYQLVCGFLNTFEVPAPV